MNLSISIWIPLIPFFVFLVNGLAGHKYKPVYAGILGTTGLFISFILSLVVGYQYFFVEGMKDGAYQQIIAFSSTWLHLTDKLVVSMGSLIDPISVMMLIVVTTVSLMVHLYSMGYMKGDKGFTRFYAFLSLFTFSMLGLVLATNIFQMYIFWELVGVSSYLLIGFYYERPSAVAASKKAFIVTRFADLGFLVGILMISYITGSFDFNQIIPQLTDPTSAAFHSGSKELFFGLSTLTWSVIFVFMGGAGKSAMFPLHIWLPDAMEGPTPVSALIHAATMVVAGVYLVARLFPIYALSAPTGLEVVAFLGGFTSLFAAVIACTQFDIKRILAFSTLSQIGYMMLALGVSGYGGEEGLGFTASMFHLFTHAMFKALLFLGAGAIIHAVHSNYMNDMGNLRKFLPITHITFAIAVLTISGIPPFAGFFSKDEILVAAYQHNKVLFFVEYLVAGITAFYMSRLYFSVFWGKNQQYHHKPHEAPFTMTIPLMFLALASVTVGFIHFSKFISTDLVPYESGFHWNIAIPSILIALAGISLAAVMYMKETTIPDRVAKSLKGFYTATYNKFYIDEVYLFVTKKIIFNLISRPVAWFDRHIVDGTVNLVGNTTTHAAEMIKGFQSGQIQKYGFVFVSGVLLLAFIFIYWWSK
ncbi:MAG: NADH-quinone oxidoreductase subunit L [Bacteroidales bacterium]|nr:NADH-quinone oxidoreductase subunit L [Bacteroidales bacterium]